MTDDRPNRERNQPNRERNQPNWLDRKLSKDELGKRKRAAEEEKLLREIAAIDRAVKHRRLFPHIQMSAPEPQEQQDAIQRVHTDIQEDADRLDRPAAAPVPPPRVPEPQEQEDAIQRVHTAIQEDADRLDRPPSRPVPPPRVPEPQEQQDAQDARWQHGPFQQDADRQAQRLAQLSRVPEPPLVMAYYPAEVEAAAALEARISAVEYKLLAKIRNRVPCVSGISRIEVLEKFLLTAEDIGAADAAPPGHRRLARLEAAVEIVEYEATLDVQRTFS